MRKIITYILIVLLMVGTVIAIDLVQVERASGSFTAVGDPYGVKGVFGTNGGVVSNDAPYGILGFEDYDVGSEEYSVGVIGIAVEGIGIFAEGIYGFYTPDDVFIGSDLTIGENVYIGDELVVEGEAGFENDVVIDQTFTVFGDAAFKSEVCIAQDGVCLGEPTNGEAKLKFDPETGTGATMMADTSGDMHIITHGEGKTVYIESYDGVGVGSDPDPVIQFDAANLEVNGAVTSNSVVTSHTTTENLVAEQVITSSIVSAGDILIHFGAME